MSMPFACTVGILEPPSGGRLYRPPATEPIVPRQAPLDQEHREYLYALTAAEQANPATSATASTPGASCPHPRMEDVRHFQERANQVHVNLYRNRRPSDLCGCG